MLIVAMVRNAIAKITSAWRCPRTPQTLIVLTVVKAARLARLAPLMVKRVYVLWRRLATIARAMQIVATTMNVISRRKSAWNVLRKLLIQTVWSKARDASLARPVPLTGSEGSAW
jgi:hypothetical protein